MSTTHTYHAAVRAVEDMEGPVLARFDSIELAQSREKVANASAIAQNLKVRYVAVSEEFTVTTA